MMSGILPVPMSHGGDGDEDRSGVDRANRYGRSDADVGLSVYQAAAGAQEAVYGAVCVQRHFGDRGDSSDPGTGTAGSAGYLRDGVRRHSGGRVSYSELDHGATAIEPHGRGGGAGPVGTN